MRYLILIFGNTRSRHESAALSDAGRARVALMHAALADELAISGELVLAETLADPSAGMRLTVCDGQAMTTDGPFTESKEYLCGVYVVESESIERVVAHASRLPEAAYGLVEVRPVVR